MKIIKLKIKTKSQSYPIIIGSNIISNIVKLARNNSVNFKQCLLIVDKNISKKIISKIRKSLIKKKLYVYYFQASEVNKNQNNVMSGLHQGCSRSQNHCDIAYLTPSFLTSTIS